MSLIFAICSLLASTGCHKSESIIAKPVRDARQGREDLQHRGREVVLVRRSLMALGNTALQCPGLIKVNLVAQNITLNLYSESDGGVGKVGDIRIVSVLISVAVPLEPEVGI